MGLSLDREPILVALAARLKAKCSGLKDVTRRYRAAHQVDPSEKPLLIVAVGTQTATVRRGAPNLWTLQIPVYLYVRRDEADATTAPGTLINLLVKQIEDALERDSTEAPPDISELYSTNLGLRNVFSCRVTAVDTDEGLLDPNGEAAIVIQVEAAPG